jgi:hypothetical protein
MPEGVGAHRVEHCFETLTVKRFIINADRGSISEALGIGPGSFGSKRSHALQSHGALQNRTEVAFNLLRIHGEIEQIAVALPIALAPKDNGLWNAPWIA